jgi:hypothetical protein
MTYFCRISIFAVKNTQNYLVFDPLKNTRMPYVQTMNRGNLNTGNSKSTPVRLAVMLRTTNQEPQFILYLYSHEAKECGECTKATCPLIIGTWILNEQLQTIVTNSISNRPLFYLDKLVNGRL